MAGAIFTVICLYVALAALFGAAFVWRGIERADPSARGASWPFRLLMLPGAVALAPMLARRWHRAARTGSGT